MGLSTVRHLKQQVESELRSNILDFWCKYTPDNENGGFYGYISADHNTDPRADKASVLNARILWTFSAACRFYNENKYRDMAARAYEYIRDHFINREHMGVYWMLDYKGAPKDTKIRSMPTPSPYMPCLSITVHSGTVPPWNWQSVCTNRWNGMQKT